MDSTRTATPTATHVHTAACASRRDYFANDLQRVRTARRCRGASGDGNFFGLLSLQIDLSVCRPFDAACYHAILGEYVRTGTLAPARCRVGGSVA